MSMGNKLTLEAAVQTSHLADNQYGRGALPEMKVQQSSTLEQPNVSSGALAYECKKEQAQLGYQPMLSVSSLTGNHNQSSILQLQSVNDSRHDEIVHILAQDALVPDTKVLVVKYEVEQSDNYQGEIAVPDRSLLVKDLKLQIAS